LLPGLTIVVPAYNEEGSLTIVVEDAARVAASALAEYEIIIVDDASVDGTFRVAQELSTRLPHVRVVRHERNQGSGGAIITGIREARCELVIYVPADGQFKIEEIGDYVGAVDGHDIVIGARMKRSDYSWFRLLSSKVFIVLVNFLFRHDLRDVNWVHLWRKRIFDSVSPRSRGVFMLEEILVRATRAGFTIREIDSLYVPRIAGRAKGSHPATIIRTIVDMLRFWLELRRTP
jgi:glycosyltransferase involved in cell wall biosynthesis